MIRHIVYKTTNKINGKIYIGVHKKVRTKDWYIGSGRLIKAAIKKYGSENFLFEELFVYASSDEAYAKEAELVNEEFIARPDTYNLIPGGIGGPGKQISEAHKKAISNSKKGIPRTEELKAKMSATRLARKIPSPNKGRKLSQAHRDSLSKAKVLKISVCGKIYESSKEIAAEYGIALSTVRARIYSDTERWSDWKYYDSSENAT